MWRGEGEGFYWPMKKYISKMQSITGLKAKAAHVHQKKEKHPEECQSAKWLFIS